MRKIKGIVKIGFSLSLVIFINTIPLFSFDLVKQSLKLPEIVPMDGNYMISYPFDIIIGRQNPFVGDSNKVYYSDRLSRLIIDADGVLGSEEKSFNGVILSRLLYGRVYNNNIFGAYLTRNYWKNISGKTAFTNCSEDTLNNYIVYQNIRWNNAKFPVVLAFAGNYRADFLKYKIKLIGRSRAQFTSFEYKEGDVFLKIANHISRFQLKGYLNTRDKLSKIGIFTHIDKSLFNKSEIGVLYDPYNMLTYIGVSHLTRLDSRNMFKSGIEYCFNGDLDAKLSYYRILPYVYTSLHYYYPADSANLSITSLFKWHYYRGYICGKAEYDTIFNYSLISYSSIIWKPKDALSLNPGVKLMSGSGGIEVIPIAEIQFIDASIYASYNLYWKKFAVIGKWDFYN